MIKRVLIGDTMKFTWVNSGVTPSDIYLSVFDESETAVDSLTMTSSGNGHYFALHTAPDTPGFYVGEILATVGGYPYKRRVKYNAQKEEV